MKESYVIQTFQTYLPLFLTKNAKIVMFKMDTYLRSGIDCRVSLLSTRYQTAKGIIPESLKSKGKFYYV